MSTCKFLGNVWRQKKFPGEECGRMFAATVHTYNRAILGGVFSA